MDRFTRWPEAVPLMDMTTLSCAWALIATWITRFGVPTHISSDRGSQFTSELWTAVGQLLGTQYHHTTAYHPQANGLVERLHHHLKSALRTKLHGPNWLDILPWVLLGIRTAPKDDLNTSSAEFVYGFPLTVPGDFVPSSSSITPSALTFLPILREKVQILAPVPTTQHGSFSFSVPPDLMTSAFVFVHQDAHRTPLRKPYVGPYKV